VSNDYSTLARRFGFDVPASYQLGYLDDVKKAMERILTDLVKSLPTIVERVTLSDLQSIESEKGGARWIAEGRFGHDYLKHVAISDFRNPTESS
jgi:hypothetical protein